jgi:hypothetical protein
MRGEFNPAPPNSTSTAATANAAQNSSSRKALLNAWTI